ncbi:hypothetical protein A3H10_04100 [Candidatus Uhrbacteria bacterium RIFCSPLOWO2_12_FULL_46_10]|uniref:Uncharacterized protein n=1 Tax=Candidatus Uhrbacteria bacterium RIFCSPLOWO2_01_FULL_47_25 TaxID=1802402 RepID=A0A1F7UUX0_9BACT|nr:MAG: hypothetical protein A2752_05095 [Candidatus Uhrbacteria bacterium RIFCSPHIGHO2_01_FULL_46_23]OGL67866.1 MAG: hypothetical protein A3D60_01360 [Candidatus Uhrbacteria bacterium RIFCSPHIGHO2_02_FULL_47_29]OGL81518.1 MAG: hypothetical protein A2936_01610 [Candidatus Uhrbacteria bacterium RIFCSPLOWO2_01_FULL_47_25]OGL85740.1 MAG: hypothetical protein A3I37_02550 [Candidatus Uhrbacteria bacterium RIFCSPLOWO2_02_FULL_46_19]OGL90611.1 MAG: hypothetical protein A3H10_04100 [Candidatus Uhrbacte
MAFLTPKGAGNKNWSPRDHIIPPRKAGGHIVFVGTPPAKRKEVTPARRGQKDLNNLCGHTNTEKLI